jgi:aflatoxin B1 aldehyde reductase
MFGDLYRTLYCKESLLAALEEWSEIANEAGITKAALAYRWATHHSALRGENGDAIVMGASSAAQLEETLSAIEEGPLKEETAKKVDAVWAKIQHEAPRDYYHDYLINLGNPTDKVLVVSTES